MNAKPHRSADFQRSVYYLLHPEERVGFIQTHNLATEAYADEMDNLVAAARSIQARHRRDNNLREQASGGEPKRACYVFSLSWHPLDNPTQRTMAESANAAVKALSLSGHQILVVEHKNRPHRHVHVLCNLVNPETGRITNMKNATWILDRFCYAVESEMGIIRSFARASRIERLPKAPRPEAAQAKAKIREVAAKREKEISAKHAANAVRRKEEWATAKTTYQQQRLDTKRKFQRQISAIWSRDDATPKHDLEPYPRDSLFPKKPEWQQLAEILNKTGTLPAGHPPPLIDRNFMRRELSDGLKHKMHQELAQLAMLYQRRCEHLKGNHGYEIKAQKQEWLDFKRQTKAQWKNWQETFILKGMDVEPLKPRFNKQMTGSEMTASKGSIAGLKEPTTQEPDKLSITPETQAQGGSSLVGKKPDMPAKRRNPYIGMSASQTEAAFGAYIRECGLDLRGDPIMDGNPQYVSIVGQPKEKRGTYFGWLGEFPSGRVYNHKDGSIEFKWPPDEYRAMLTPQERGRLEKQQASQEAQRKAQTQARHDDAAKHAKLIWDQCAPASPDHAYIVKKGINPAGIRQCRKDIYMPRKDGSKPDINLNHALIIPRFDLAGRLRSIQAVRPDGFKMNLTHAQKVETAFVMGRLENGKPIAISEGYATGKTVHEATHLTTAIAFDTGNILSITEALRKKFPDSPILLLADNDKTTFTTQGLIDAGRPDKKAIPGDDPHWQKWEDKGYLQNPGMEAAEDVYQAVEGCIIVAPQFEPQDRHLSDWNDYGQLYGLDSVASQFSAYMPAPETSAEIEQSMDYSL